MLSGMILQIGRAGLVSERLAQLPRQLAQEANGLCTWDNCWIGFRHFGASASCTVAHSSLSFGLVLHLAAGVLSLGPCACEQAIPVIIAPTTQEAAILILSVPVVIKVETVFCPSSRAISLSPASGPLFSIA